MTLRRRILLVNPNTDRSVTAWLEAETRRVAGPDVTIAAVNAAAGLAAIETPADIATAARSVVDAIGSRTDIDGAIIGAFGDPGLAEARAACAVPVAGMGEAGLAAAAEGGRRFAIVTLGAAMEAPIRTRLDALGFAHQCAALVILPIGIREVVGDRNRYRPMIEDAVRRCLDRDGAAAALLGGAPFAGLAHDLAQTLGRPVLDGVAEGLKALFSSTEPRPPLHRPRLGPAHGLGR